jgi:type II secretory ATPase GspE/PulE/Tfp pilus assembly ATPase PilB-like protein
MIVCNKCGEECKVEVVVNFVATMGSSAVTPVFRGHLCQPCKKEFYSYLRTYIKEFMDDEKANKGQLSECSVQKGQ